MRKFAGISILLLFIGYFLLEKTDQEAVASEHGWSAFRGKRMTNPKPSFVD